MITILFLAEIAVATTERQDQVYRSVKQMPQFPSGEAALMKYIKSQLQWPQTQNCCYGSVIVKFVVQSDGNIGDVKVVRSLHPDDDKGAIRVIKSLPKFTPGRHNGQAVAVWYTLIVHFR